MITSKKAAIAAGLCALAAFGQDTAQAQSTDGYHTIQVIPVVVDSASFTQHFSFQNGDHEQSANVTATFVPAQGSSQPGPLTCSNFTIPSPYGFTVFTSLRELCPGLAAGSQFGYLYLAETGGGNLPFGAYSRISNPQGQGFSVESFPAHTFTSADAVVTGLRRLSATASSPAYQTNCFFGNLHDLSPNSPAVTTSVAVQLTDRNGVNIANTAIDLVPGRLVRLLDVFSAAGAPAGDYDDAMLHAFENGTGEPALMTFCTVQDNTSFGADFRIGKQEQGNGSDFPSVGAHDDHVSRDSVMSADLPMPGAASGRPFTINPGSFANTHVMYFRHPDYVQCELIDPATGVRALPAYGLELRLVADDGFTVLAGGDGVTGFGKVYLGDKTEYNYGANTRYTINVESSETNLAAARPYRLHCQSGSGHSAGDMIRYNEAVDRF